MDMLMNYGKGLTAAVSVVASYLFGEWSQLLLAFVVFVTFDYISGLVAASYENKLDARVGFWGIPKKVMMFGVVALAHIIDIVYLDVAGEAMAIGDFKVSVMAATILYYLVNEFISITENLGRLGMPMPTPLKRAIEIFKDNSYKNDQDKGA